MIIKKIKCPHVLIDLLLKYYNFKDYKQILEIKYMLYINQVKIKKILMDLIYESAKTSTQNYKLSILFRKIRSSESCCIDYYINLCLAYQFNHISLLDLYNNYEKEITKKLNNLFSLNIMDNLNVYMTLHDVDFLHKYVFNDEYKIFIDFLNTF